MSHRKGKFGGGGHGAHGAGPETARPAWLGQLDRPSSQRFEAARAALRSGKAGAVSELGRVQEEGEPPHRAPKPPDYERSERLDKLFATAAPVGKLYVTPYLTCKECNALNWIDSEAFVPTVREDGRLTIALPECVECGTTLDIGIGADDHTDLIEAKRRARIEEKKRRKRGASSIQAAFRGMKGRREAARRRELHEKFLAMIERSAVQIQCAARAADARKIAKVRKALLRIKSTVKSVLYEALRMKSTDGKKRHIWWYTRKAELDLVYKDYLVFVERTGRMPPRHIVESNILEIVARIGIIEDRNAVVIQAMFRGVVERMFVKELIQEFARLRSVRVTATLIIQTWWRLIIASNVLEQKRYELRCDQIRRKYLEDKRKQMDARHDAIIKETAKIHYKKEVRESRTAVVTGKTSYHEYGGRKLIAYHKSAFGGDPTASKMVREFLERRAADHRRKERMIDYKLERNKYILARVNYKQGFRRYFTDEHTGVAEEKERLRNIVVEREKITPYSSLKRAGPI